MFYTDANNLLLSLEYCSSGYLVVPRPLASQRMFVRRSKHLSDFHATSVLTSWLAAEVVQRVRCVTAYYKFYTNQLCELCTRFGDISRFLTTSFRTSWVTTKCVRTNEWNVARFVCLQQCVRLTSSVTSSSTFLTQSSVHVNSATTNTQTVNTFITIRSMSWNKYSKFKEITIENIEVFCGSVFRNILIVKNIITF